MTTPDLLAVIATLAGVMMALAPALQIRRMFHTRSSRDVSLLYLTMLDLGFVAWISYGWAIGNPALLLSNSASMTFMTVTILVALAFRRGKGSNADRPATPIEIEAPGSADS